MPLKHALGRLELAEHGIGSAVIRQRDVEPADLLDACRAHAAAERGRQKLRPEADPEDGLVDGRLDDVDLVAEVPDSDRPRRLHRSAEDDEPVVAPHVEHVVVLRP